MVVHSHLYQLAPMLSLWSLWEPPLDEREKRFFSIWPAQPRRPARRLSKMLGLVLCRSTLLPQKNF